MNLIRQKQIHKLEEDISNLYLGSDVFKRFTVFSLGIPEEGEACLDSSEASLVTTLHIHTTDSITGNRFITLSEYQQYDHLIVNIGTEVIKYEINSIQEAVDGTNEGHFILTLQHSFGYSSSLTSGEFTYYFRKSAADELIENNSIQITVERNRALAAEALEISRATAAESSLQSQINSLVPKGYVELLDLTDEYSTAVEHSLDTTNIIIQVVNTGTGVQVTHQCTISNYSLNSIDIQAPAEDSYKVIILPVGSIVGSPEPPPEPPVGEYTQTHVMNFDSSKISAPGLNLTEGISISAWINTTGTTGTRVIVAQDRFSSTSQRDWALYLDGGNNLRFYTFNPDGSGNYSLSIASPAGTITDGNWHHVAVAWDGTISTDAMMSFDGDVVKTVTASAAGIKNTSPYGSSIGSYHSPGASGYFYNGKISNIQVWEKGISELQMAELWNGGAPLTEPIEQSDLVAWWKLDSDSVWDGTDWNIPDSSGNENDGIGHGVDGNASMDETNLIEEEI